MSLYDAIERVNFTRDARNCDPDSAPVLYLANADGSTTEFKLPTKWVVCSVCGGNGSHVNPSIDCNGLTAEDFADDPDFADDYMSGAYDIPCNRCQGRTTVHEVDWDRLAPKQLAAYQRQLKEEAYERAEHLAELRAGA